MDEWKCPEGWRVKADDEIVEHGDAYSHWSNGDEHGEPSIVSQSVGMSVSMARSEMMPVRGFILSLCTEKEPIQLPANDTCLVWLAGKIDQAAKSHPEKADELRQQWFAAKSELASRMLAKIEGLT